MLILFINFTRIKQTPTTILPKQQHIYLWFIYSICNLIKKKFRHVIFHFHRFPISYIYYFFCLILNATYHQIYVWQDYVLNVAKEICLMNLHMKRLQMSYWISYLAVKSSVYCNFLQINLSLPLYLRPMGSFIRRK